MVRPSLLAVLALLWASAGNAQETWPDGWGFQWQIGYNQSSGAWSETVEGGVDADINIFYDLRKYRIGAGGNFASYDLIDPLPDTLESIATVELHGFFAYHFLRGPVQPYVQARGTWTRLRPEGYHPAFEPPEDGEEPEEGENNAPKRDGFGFGLVGGLEWRISYSLGFEVAVNWDTFSVEEVDLSPLGITPGVFDSGANWGGRVGINWYP